MLQGQDGLKVLDHVVEQHVPHDGKVRSWFFSASRSKLLELILSVVGYPNLIVERTDGETRVLILMGMFSKHIGLVNSNETDSKCFGLEVVLNLHNGYVRTAYPVYNCYGNFLKIS